MVSDEEYFMTSESITEWDATLQAYPNLIHSKPLFMFSTNLEYRLWNGPWAIDIVDRAVRGE